MMPYNCTEFEGCNRGFIEVYDFIEHELQHILKGEIEIRHIKKYNIYSDKILQINMKMLYLLENYYNSFDSLYQISDYHRERYITEFEKCANESIKYKKCIICGQPSIGIKCRECYEKKRTPVSKRQFG